MEYKGEKMSMVEYTEKILGVKLYPFQKQFLQKLEKLPPDSKLISTPRGMIVIRENSSRGNLKSFQLCLIDKPLL